jgi:hypothetical protein
MHLPAAEELVMPTTIKIVSFCPQKLLADPVSCSLCKQYRCWLGAVKVVGTTLAIMQSVRKTEQCAITNPKKCHYVVKIICKFPFQTHGQKTMHRGT